MNTYNNNLVMPTVIKRTSSGDRAYDLDSLLLADRTISLDGEVTDGAANIIRNELLYLNSLDPESPIAFYITSPGGSVHAGFSIIDTMANISAPVYTFGTGYCASMGAAILSCGEKGHRYVQPHCQVMVHQVSSGAQGTVHDLMVNVNYDKRLNNIVLALIAKNAGRLTEKEYQTIDDAVQDMKDDDESSVLVLPKTLENKFKAFKKEYDRDTWLMPKAAIKAGIADQIITKISLIK